MSNAIVKQEEADYSAMLRTPEEQEREFNKWVWMFYHELTPPVSAYPPGTEVFGRWASAPPLTVPPTLPATACPACAQHCASNARNPAAVPAAGTVNAPLNLRAWEQAYLHNHINKIPQAEWAFVFVQDRAEDRGVKIRDLLNNDPSHMRDAHEEIPTTKDYIILEYPCGGTSGRLPVKCEHERQHGITKFMLAQRVAKYMDVCIKEQDRVSFLSGYLFGLYTNNGGRTFKFVFGKERAPRVKLENATA
ncbi:hypothetical protein AX16_007511 [Volvariella volvacea WC 439]|nr:hypothetical protein AX16_007511 [Volvariella volvacea WC 439]